MENVKWLDEKKIKMQLTRIGHFLLAYELLLSAVVDRVRDFYLIGLKDGKLLYSENYKTEVLSKAKHVYEASLLWLKENNVISATDVDVLIKIRELRNKIAHDVPHYVFSGDKPYKSEKLKTIQDYVRRIDRFWGQIEVETDFELLEKIKDIDFEGIVSLRSLALDYISQGLQSEDIDN